MQKDRIILELDYLGQFERDILEALMKQDIFTEKRFRYFKIRNNKPVLFNAKNDLLIVEFEDFIKEYFNVEIYDYGK